MKIKSVEIETSHIIETEEGVFYRRNGPDSWEELFGMSWETVVFRENLEEKFQKFMKNRQEALNKMYENEEQLGLDW